MTSISIKASPDDLANVYSNFAHIRKYWPTFNMDDLHMDVCHVCVWYLQMLANVGCIIWRRLIRLVLQRLLEILIQFIYHRHNLFIWRIQDLSLLSIFLAIQIKLWICKIQLVYCKCETVLFFTNFSFSKEIPRIFTRYRLQRSRNK